MLGQLDSPLRDDALVTKKPLSLDLSPKWRSWELENCEALPVYS